MTESLEELKAKAVQAQQRFNEENQRFWYWQQISIALVNSNRDVHLNDIPKAADALVNSWEQRYAQMIAFQERNNEAWNKFREAELATGIKDPELL